MINDNYFNANKVPKMNISRSRHHMPKPLFTTMNMGDLIPVYCKRVYPNDTFEMKNIVDVTRTTQPLTKPLMNAIEQELHFFYVPDRIIWNKTAEYYGYNDDEWNQKARPSHPTIGYLTASKDGIPDIGYSTTVGTLNDYFANCLPNKNHKNTKGKTISRLPFMAYCQIYNDWFRDQNIQKALKIDKDATGKYDMPQTNLTYESDPITTAQYGGGIANVCKKHDYFTDAVPSPQKGEPITLTLTGLAPVIPGDEHPTTEYRQRPIKMTSAEGTPLAGAALGTSNGQMYTIPGQTGAQGQAFFSNLWADTTNLTSIDINDLRLALAQQRKLELDTRGTRYNEYLYNHWGTIIDDKTVQRSEYLYGKRYPLSINQAVQVGGGELGNIGAYGYDVGQNMSFIKTVQEPGYIIGLKFIRQQHIYEQGIDRANFLTIENEDEYEPVFANLGYQAIKSEEIDAEEDSYTFGYTNAYNELRNEHGSATGLMRTKFYNPKTKQMEDGFGSLYVMADYYDSKPTLSNDWIVETPAWFAKTQAVMDESLPNQFMTNLYFDVTMVRQLPAYATPKIIG